MTQQFTASEVRERERFEDWYTTHTFNYSRDPIGSRDCSLQWEAWKAALADLLEAREKAVPVAYAAGLEANMRGFLDVMAWSEGEFTIPLYTHPAPSNAERLAEALRQAAQSLRTIERGAMREEGLEDAENVRAYARSRADVAGNALAAHFAQAQPHTAHPEHSCEECGGQNVTWFAPSELWNEVVRSPDGREPMLCPMCFIKRAEKVGHSKDAWSVCPEFYEESAQPPAASVPEVTGLTWEPPNVTVDVERVGRFRSGDEHIVRVTFRSSDDGRRMTCFYAANESAVGYLHAMLAAQENPNG